LFILLQNQTKVQLSVFWFVVVNQADDCWGCL
jgi:hypothetical protein